MLADPTFVITSVSFTNDKGVVQTMNFDPDTKSVQIPAVACKNAITINGTITPTAAGTMVTGTVNFMPDKLEKVSAAPKLDGKGGWTLSVPAASLAPNTGNGVNASNNNGMNLNQLIINNVKTDVKPVTVNIAAAP